MEIIRYCHWNTPLQLALLPLRPGSHNPPRSWEAGFAESRQGQISRKLKIPSLCLGSKAWATTD